MPRKKAAPQCFAAVKGIGRFPVDMLRYDACWPAEQEDASRIDRFSYGVQSCGVVVVENDGRHWTGARWKSFLWEIVALADNAPDARRRGEEAAAARPVRP